MIRVFLADDNRLVRESLLQSVDWIGNGYEIVGTAENGIEAQQRICQEKPDILILDIKMPGKTGLEVLEEVRRQSVPCECIIVTGYDEFTYAQQGIRLGVSDFLLKPVDNGELLEALRRAGACVAKRRQKALAGQRERTEGEALAKSGVESLPEEVKGKLFRKLMMEGISGNGDAVSRMEEDLRGLYRFNCCELMLIYPEMEWKQGKGSEEVGAFIETEERLLAENSRGKNYLLLDAWTRNGLAVLILFQGVQFGKDYDLSALRIANDIFAKNRALGIETSVSISSQTKVLSDLPLLYEQAMYAHNSRFFFENRNVIHYGTVKSRGIKNGYSMRRELDEFYRTMKEQPEELAGCIRQIGCLIGENAAYDVEYIKSILVHMGLMINGAMQEMNGGSNEAFLQAIVQNINEARNIGEALSWLEDYANQMADLQKKSRGSKYSAVTVKILDYLKSNYAEKASLQEVADYMGLSVSHICRLLKNETGETFTALMNKIRIQEAIRMLRSGEYRVYEIAEKVGFGNYAYFYQLFKKEMGCSPTEFCSEDYNRK